MGTVRRQIIKDVVLRIRIEFISVAFVFQPIPEPIAPREAVADQRGEAERSPRAKDEARGKGSERFRNQVHPPRRRP
jgi:hypothetical protein